MLAAAHGCTHAGVAQTQMLRCDGAGQVTCGVHATVVDSVVDDISAAIDRAGVRARLILSGKGDWRFLDIVPANAGKLAALECAL